jgi:NAD(P)-dependent dehydrogenase (short-subunit alcohol dehydrogenase family)
VAVASRTKAECDEWIKCDLLDNYERTTLIERAGDIDVLVNNSGMQGHSKFTDIDWYDWNHHIELMLTVPFLLSQQFARTRARGQIINILSTSAFQGARYLAPYVAAKHGLLGLTRAMAVELAPDIRVNAIAPGLIQTDMTKEYITPERRALLESITPAGRFGYGFEIADALLWLINTTYVYGQVITVDGGWMVKNG